MPKTIYIWTADGQRIRRCLSNAPIHTDQQCEKPSSHLRTEDRPKHQNGDLIWEDFHTPASLDPAQIYPSAFNEKQPTLADELTDWWYKAAADEISKTVAKAVEYGSTDLIDIGVMLGRTMRRPVDEQEAAELGVFFYLIGKVARWQAAIERGDRPSDDTLLDIGIYVRMAQRIRTVGGWPGTRAPQDGEPDAAHI